MVIDVTRIGTQGLVLQDKVTLDEHLLIEEESRFTDELIYTVQFNRDGDKIRAKGHIKTNVSLPCVNCLENFELKVDSKFDVILFPARSIEAKHTPLSNDEMEYIFFDGDSIDLDRLLVEQVNLFIPYNPICSPYCKGLCPNCGVNLNYHDCQCENSISEMRLFFDKI